jgi:hypothetical protein
MVSFFPLLNFPHGRRDGCRALLGANKPKAGDQIAVALSARLLWCQFGQRCLPKPRRQSSDNRSGRSRSEPELLRAMFDVGYFPPKTPPVNLSRKAAV